MAYGTDDALHGGDQEPGSGRGFGDHAGSAAAGWFALHGSPGVPPWMTTELAGLRAAFPAFSFAVRPGWRGLTFEAWRDCGAGGLYAVVTRDAGELRRELEGIQLIGGDRGLPKQ